MVPSYTDTAEAYANATSQCRTPDVIGSWVTDPSKALEVDVQGVAGTVSQNAWPVVCMLYSAGLPRLSPFHCPLSHLFPLPFPPRLAPPFLVS